MTMQYRILVGEHLEKEKSEKVLQVVADTFHDTDTIFNKWNPNSELSRLNAQKAGIASTLSPLMVRLFNETDYIVYLTGGKFDPTIEPLQKLWKQKLQEEKIPEQSEIDHIAQSIGWDRISFTEGIFKKKNDLTQLDFGGIAKGLCIDLIVERLNEAGFCNLYVEWGGEIRTCGVHPEGRLWTVFISRLGDIDPGNAIDTLELKDQAIATSGDYLQNWTVELPEGSSATYFHIFDPKTLRPLKSTSISIASASVTAPSCAMADGLATALMMFPNAEEASKWAESIKEQIPGISYWIVSRGVIRPSRPE